MSARQAPDRNIAMELVRVTEAGAMAAARWIGRGDKEEADQAAVDAMRFVLDSVSMRGVVVIGEGEKDEAPMLYNGEEVGNGEGPEVDVAVDPLEGTRLTALGQPNAIAVIAVAERGTMLFPGAALYMEKIAVGPDAIDAIDIERSPTENVVAVAEALGKTPREVDVVVLERDRHDELIAELRDGGRARPPDPRRRRRAGDRGGAAGHGRRHALRDRRHARGRDLGGGAEVRRRRHPGTALAAQRRRAAAAARRRSRPGARPPHERPRLGRGRLRRRDGRHDGLAPPGRAGTRPEERVTDSIVMRSRSGTVRRVVAQQSLAKLSALTGFEYT